MTLPWGLQPYYFEPVNQHMGAFIVKIQDAFISHSKWRLIYHYDLTDFYDNINLYQDSLVKLDEICTKIEENQESTQCSALVKKHKAFLENINVDIEYLEEIQNENKKRGNRLYRKKRDAPLGYLSTYIFKPIFGIMDEEDAEQISEKINELAENQQAYHTILEHNLSIISKMTDTTNDTMFEFKKGDGGDEHLHRKPNRSITNTRIQNKPTYWLRIYIRPSDKH